MFSFHLAVSDSRPPQAQKLEAARDRLRIQIRKDSIQCKLLANRQCYMQNNSAENDVIIGQLQALNVRQLTEEVVSSLADKLYKNKDQELCLKIAQNCLVNRLLSLLTAKGDLQTKINLATFLNDTLFYSRTSSKQCQNGMVVDFCQQQITQNTLSNEQDATYVAELLKIVRNIASQGTLDFNLYLVDYNFCQKVYDKLKGNPPCAKATRELMKIIADILTTKENDEKLNIFQRRAMNYLNLCLIGQHQFELEYLDILIRLIKRGVNEVELMSHYPDIILYVCGMIGPEYRPKCDIVPLFMRYLKLLLNLNQYGYNELIGEMESQYGYPSKQLFLWALNHENEYLANYCLRTFQVYQRNYVKRFNPSVQQIMQIMTVIFDRFWRESTAYSSLRILREFLDSKFMDFLLSTGLLTKILELTQLLMVPMDVDVVMEIMGLIRQIITHAQNEGTIKNVKRTLASNGLQGWIEALILNKDQQVSKMAENIIDGKLKVHQERMESQN